MTDFKLFQTVDNGDIQVTNGNLLMDDSPETAVYLSLFGGNEDDPGESDLTKQWWGNALSTDTTTHYRSRTQYLLRSIPQTSANLNKIKLAVESDLAWARTAGLFKDFEIFVSVPKINWLSIQIATEPGTLQFVVPWEVSV
jgi:phage gp46-like protein